jgi:TolA-binding protein
MKNATSIMVTIIFLICCSFFGCSEQKKPANKKQNVTTEDITKEVQDVVETASAFTEQQRQEYQRQIEAKLKEYDQKVNTMITQIENMKESASEDLKGEIDTLSNKKEEVAKKIDAIKVASGAAWDELKVGIDNALAELEKALEQASVSKDS